MQTDAAHTVPQLRREAGGSAWGLAATLLVVAVLTIASVLVQMSGLPASTVAAADVSPSAAAPAPVVTVTPSPPPLAGVPEDVTEPLTPPVALFIGDSYSYGTGASDDEHRWTTRVAQIEGWEEVNHAYGGTGYISLSNVCAPDLCPAYSEAIDEAVADGVQPAIVVIAGGQNDTDEWLAGVDVVAAIQETYEKARAEFPHAWIIAVGPSWIGDVQDWQVDFDQAVQDAAAAVGASYISLLDPQVLDDPSYTVEDGVHVDDAGHAAIARRVIESLTLMRAEPRETPAAAPALAAARY
ncbi:GDSL-type esterase/lipase family protein [Demequina capsici]|uniref:GDSL-type esterase/lipase family protein n=1 Tax=Demequina capsici TaxID=3075620 RepID=A0AA96JDQ3_9MICO|nr:MULTISPECIES: GDSL-type esterase/lipase family protein [unclassified Demequina]WNM24914.1 GDSL-type esterase/lipase family protein [Demequina sp. OYTSA14]WNM27821.1 GDSL-type esterase/lipase family protein [Demequina sp. PMTSA13]